MGSSLFKFRKYLSNGDEVVVFYFYNNNSDFRKGFDLNCLYGDYYNYEIFLYYVVRYVMKSFLRLL